mmetsp:Transcript_10813/g.17812  ORF Transcript_10813/g.17812 Transcript_10813/m.17812 type:complete len:125 (-) Transcript_10813:193-567(-)|eukprot:CAMPEP_0169166636 /NCGR_PEP_ID=MMETSP1015-20121227/60041_1 /TAXON_ID=342587 /ORGANISM="Karlodinium micrum, Strain CCMP2283" /LENGTH=124 /DNA_ID=CAMNT_0009239287 /DNA_START=53 /DNA_END=427 /DNA_ORIENTATION=+
MSVGHHRELSIGEDEVNDLVVAHYDISTPRGYYEIFTPKACPEDLPSRRRRDSEDSECSDVSGSHDDRMPHFFRELEEKLLQAQWNSDATRAHLKLSLARGSADVGRKSVLAVACVRASYVGGE